jgi:hypothetical protein
VPANEGDLKEGMELLVKLGNLQIFGEKAHVNAKK